MGLTKLKVYIGNPSPPIFQHPGLLRRISSLSLACCIQPRKPIPWIELTNMKHLEIHLERFGEYPTLGLSSIVAPHLSSLSLRGVFGHDDFFTHEVLKNLSQLILHLEIPVEDMLPQNFPNLSFLSLGALDSGILQRIKADSLVKFTLSSVLSYAPSEEYFNASISPRIVHLNIDDEGERFSSFIGGDYGPFAKRARIWSIMEQLHLTFFEGTDSLPLVITDLLLGDRFDPPSFPKLFHLTVRYSTANRDEPTEWEKRAQAHQLLSIMYARMNSGFPELVTLEVGWHPAESMDEVKFGGKEWWVTEWRNCLQVTGVSLFFWISILSGQGMVIWRELAKHPEGKVTHKVTS